MLHKTVSLACWPNNSIFVGEQRTELLATANPEAKARDRHICRTLY